MRGEPARALTIREITRLIKNKLEGDPGLQDVWLRGEISNFTLHSSGHMYFTLKDENARLKCIMFASYNQRLPFAPKNGMKVLARGGVSVYERDGQYQFYATAMQPDGIGSLYLAFEQLKRKLEEEGLFRPEAKRALPLYPRTVGVITSPTGAAVRDILITLERRNPGVHVLLYPVSVQGTGAAPSIVKAIREMNELGAADVLIVGRGGGSLEELWAFNEEVVARAIRASAIPVISAVGHETDFTISDFAADIRAATPTAAAELAVRHIGELRQELAHLEQRMSGALGRGLARAKERWQHAARSPYFTQPRRSLLVQAERLDRLKEALRYRIRAEQSRAQERATRLAGRLQAVNPRQQIVHARQRVTAASKGLELAMNAIARDKASRFGSLVRQLDALSPLKVMARGYSLAYDEQEQKLIRSVNEVQPGDLIRLRLTDGKLDCQIWGIHGEEQVNG
ncbi:exodeoxyribonuclease VII large subunit [Cohnella sp. CIP 111063]|uniref:exodeoxyribonuclease VII large subunit n=1 Tax=unclassified Cohnella TaxID=2636738 RepID=UPI000B8C1762|nr:MULTISPECIES: exodeoxyribonuclease VII large subunit [unclassified Cohnella]OXS52405.1 exodeoxyribonuclease VII large subunit [Cohnella sp. CIP 111063]PRX58262.1 exodeoxyribonuclease VII large subunit [Cohnella sp. SGD-V74]